MRRSFSPWVVLLLPVLALTLLGCGCAGHRPMAYALQAGGPGAAETAQARQALDRLYPPEYRATQRAIITVRGKQFVCDGVLTASPAQGRHLAVVSTMGLVTEVRVKPDATTELVKVTPLMRPDWSRDYVARDLRELFGPARPLQREARLSDGRVVLESRPTPEGETIRYIFTPSGERLSELEIVREGRREVLASLSGYHSYPGYSAPIPSQFRVRAPAYQLDLRTTEMRIGPRQAALVHGPDRP